MKILILALCLFASFQASASDMINLAGMRNTVIDASIVEDYVIVTAADNKNGIEIAQIMIETDEDSKCAIWVGFLHVLLKSDDVNHGVVFLPHPVTIQAGDALVAKVSMGKPYINIWYKVL